MDKPKHPGGRPRKYQTAEELQIAITDYFDNGVKTKTVVSGRKEDPIITEIPVPTITGLVLHCGFCDRHSFYDLEKIPEFTHTIKRARAFIERHYEELLQAGNTIGAIFALKNFGWKDRSEMEVTGSLSIEDKLAALRGDKG